MSNIPSTPSAPAAPASPPAPAASPAITENRGATRNGSVLPEGVKVDHSHSADTFFAAHQQANPPVPVVGSPTPAAPAVPATLAASVVTAAPTPELPVAPAKGSLSEKLLAKSKPAAPSAPVAPAAPVAGSENPEDAITLDPKYSAPAHESFQKIKGITVGLRDQLNAAREETRQLKTQLDAAKSGAPAADTAEIDKLRAEHKTMSERLMLVDLREHPRFQAEFVAPQQQALTSASELLTAAGVTNIDVQSLLLKPRAEFGKAVSEAAQKLSDFDRTDFAENMRKAWTLHQQAGAALTKSRETYGALRNQTDAQHKQVFERTWGRAAGQVAEHIVELEVPENATADVRSEIESYNSAFKGLRTVAEQRALGVASTESVAENAIKSAAYDFHIQQAMPRLMKEIDGLLTLNRQLAAELKGVRDRNPNRQISGSPAPGAGSGGANPDGTLSNDQLSKMSHADAAAALAPRRVG
jgi:hypothetical protein